MDAFLDFVNPWAPLATFVVTAMWLFLTSRSLRTAREANETARRSNELAGAANQATRDASEVAVQVAREANQTTREASEAAILLAREANEEAREANRTSREALRQQAQLDARPWLHVEAHDVVDGEGGYSLRLVIHNTSQGPAVASEFLLFRHNYHVWFDEEEQEPVEEEKTIADAKFSAPLLLPSRRYEYEVGGTDRSTSKSLLVQFFDALGNSYSELYAFGMPGLDGEGRLPLLHKRASGPAARPQWRVDWADEDRALLEVAEAVSEEEVPTDLREAVQGTTPMALTWSSVNVRAEDAPAR